MGTPADVDVEKNMTLDLLDATFPGTYAPSQFANVYLW
jgi:hypothetical protein